ncbi:MAG: hypothetical protein U9R01_02775 [candidate division WOR-3 bacterium]|nr:hypothetical protein [candidate division WOR-3 bacterium]
MRDAKWGKGVMVGATSSGCAETTVAQHPYGAASLSTDAQHPYGQVDWS